MAGNQLFGSAVADGFSDSIAAIYDPNAPKQYIIQRFDKLNQDLQGKLNLAKLYKIWNQLCKEKIAINRKIEELQQQANKLVGTGLDGIGAQLQLDRAYKYGEPYADWQFENLSICIGRAINSKRNKIGYKLSMGKGTAKDQSTIVVLNNALQSISYTNLSSINNVIKVLAEQIPSVEISFTELKKFWDKLQR